MWLTSKRPARVRTARCSLDVPEYSTGMSQPPKGTILAPDARWRSFSGVFLSGTAVACSMESMRAELQCPEQVTVLCAFGRGQESAARSVGRQPRSPRHQIERGRDADPRDAEGVPRLPKRLRQKRHGGSHHESTEEKSSDNREKLSHVALTFPGHAALSGTASHERYSNQ